MQVTADQVLVATGPRPNTAGLGLEAAGVGLGERGAVVADEFCSMSNPRIWAAGDVTGAPQFVYVAAAQGALAAGNAIGKLGRTIDWTGLPKVTFTTPQIASVGLTEEEVTRAGHRVESRSSPSPWPVGGDGRSPRRRRGDRHCIARRAGTRAARRRIQPGRGVDARVGADCTSPGASRTASPSSSASPACSSSPRMEACTRRCSTRCPSGGRTSTRSSGPSATSTTTTILGYGTATGFALRALLGAQPW